MCISSDTLSGALFPAVGRVVSCTAGCSLQISEPDLFFQLCGHSGMVCHSRSGTKAALEAPTNCHKAWLNTSNYCCIQMSFQGCMITVRVLGSLLSVQVT